MKDKGHENASEKQLSSFNYYLQRLSLGTSRHSVAARLALSLNKKATCPDAFRNAATKN